MNENTLTTTDDSKTKMSDILPYTKLLENNTNRGTVVIGYILFAAIGFIFGAGCGVFFGYLIWK